MEIVKTVMYVIWSVVGLVVIGTSLWAMVYMKSFYKMDYDEEA